MNIYNAVLSYYLVHISSNYYYYFIQQTLVIMNPNLKQKPSINILSLFCLCVWPIIDSAPGGHTDLRPMSLEPVWPGGVQPGKNFIWKWTVAELF
jgi:hypothetical protein